jgi:hypothetical protein
MPKPVNRWQVWGAEFLKTPLLNPTAGFAFAPAFLIAQLSEPNLQV